MNKSLIALLIATAVPASGTIISGTVTGGTALAAGATFVKLSVPLSNPFGSPDSVGNDNFQSPNLFGFDEDQNILLTAPLSVDVCASPIPAGTVVASHYVFFDPGPTENVIGTVNFDSNILDSHQFDEPGRHRFPRQYRCELSEPHRQGLGSRRLGDDQRVAANPF